jgi:hypothetical protein
LTEDEHAIIARWLAGSRYASSAASNTDGAMRGPRSATRPSNTPVARHRKHQEGRRGLRIERD